MRLRRQEEAIPVWRDLLNKYPNDKDGHANLGDILLNLKRYNEAVPELEAAVALNKSSSSLKIALANAYLGAGNTDNAVAPLKEAAETTLNPADWNNAAYALADHNLSLPDAHRYAQKAVASVEDDAAKIRLDNLEVADLKRMLQLAQFWDTMGWVYFREERLREGAKIPGSGVGSRAEPGNGRTPGSNL